MLNLLRSALVVRCRESVKRTERLILEEGTRNILESWTLLLWEIAEDIGEAEERLEELQGRIKTKNRIHEEDLLFWEELQNELAEQHQKALIKEKEKSKRLIRNLEKELQEKEEELEKAMEIKSQLVDRINNIFKKKNSIRVKKSALLKDKECLLEELEKQKEKVASLEKELEETKRILAEESEKCFQEGIIMGRKLADIEEIGVLEELQILKEIEMALEGNLRRTDSEITLQTNLNDIG